MLLENVQRRATKFILGYPENMNYKERLSNLGIMPLEYRREMADLILFFKFQTGVVVWVIFLTKIVKVVI
jgi:hypothetical protein